MTDILALQTRLEEIEEELEDKGTFQGANKLELVAEKIQIERQLNEEFGTEPRFTNFHLVLIVVLIISITLGGVLL